MKLNDLYHVMGEDLQVSATGGLKLVSGPERGQQRVLRRLITAASDYIWVPEYGSGLPLMIGGTTNAMAIRGNIRAQLAREESVAIEPPANVDVLANVSGTTTVTIQYADADTGENQILTL